MIGLKRQNKKISIVLVIVLLLNLFPAMAKAEVTKTDVKVEFESLELNGGWILYNNTGFSGGQGIKNGGNNQTYTFTFNGVNIKFPFRFYVPPQNNGKISVQIDGVEIYSYQKYQSIEANGYIIIQKDYLPEGNHTVTVFAPAGVSVYLDYFIYNFLPQQSVVEYAYYAYGKIYIQWVNNGASKYNLYIDDNLVSSISGITNNVKNNINNTVYTIPDRNLFKDYKIVIGTETALGEVYSSPKILSYNIPDPPYRQEFESIIEPGWIINGSYLVGDTGKSYFIDFKGENIKVVGRWKAKYYLQPGGYYIYVDGVKKKEVYYSYPDQYYYYGINVTLNNLGTGIHTLEVRPVGSNVIMELDYFETLVPPGVPTVNSIYANYDLINISWNTSQGALSYSVVVNDNIVASGLTTTSYTYQVRSPGNYKINIMANNEAGSTLSIDYYINVTMLPEKPNVNYNVYRGILQLNLISYGAISYKIFVNGQEVGQTNSNNFEYQFTQNGNYSFYVVAMNLYGETVVDNIDLGYVYVPPEKPSLWYEFVNGVLRLYWNQALNAIDYLLHKDNQQITTTTENFYQINLGQILNSSLYAFKLYARNPLYTTESDPIQILLLAKPKNATGRYIDTDKKIEVTWDADPYAEGYYIERSEDGQIFRTVAQTSQNSYIDTDVKPNKKYYYRVKSFNTAY